MATNPETTDEDLGKNTEDDFVILETFENMADSGTSSASTIPEKQTYESLEKLSGSFNSLGDSTINEQPYYESSQFIEKQLGIERKRGLFGEGEGKEKCDELCGEKGGSGNECGKGVEFKEKIKGENLQEDVEVSGVKGKEIDVGGGDVDWEARDVGGGDVHGDNVEGSWMYVKGMPGDSMVGGEDEATGKGVKLVGGEKQEREMSKNDEDQVREADMKFVGGVNLEGKEMSTEEELANVGVEGTATGSPSNEPSTKNKEETNGEDAEEMSHIEDISSIGQIEVGDDSGVGDEIPVNGDAPFEENVARPPTDSASQVDQSLELSQSLPEDSSVEDLLSDETSMDSEKHHMTDELVNKVCNQPDKRPPQLIGQPINDHTGNQPNQGLPSQPDETAPLLIDQPVNEVCNQPSVRPAQLINEPVKEDENQFDERSRLIDQHEPVNKDHSQPSDNGSPQLIDQPVNQDDNIIEQHEPVNEDDNQPDEIAPQQIDQPANEDNNRLEERPHQPIAPNQGLSHCSQLFLFGLVGLVSAIAVVHFWPASLPQHKPFIEITTKMHISPLAKSWELVGRCKSYNSSYFIQYCQWRQIHPLPTSPENTVLPGGTKKCPPIISNYDIDATLRGLTVPTDLGTYTFELACGHRFGNIATKRVEIWVNELIPPIITVGNPKVTLSTSTGSTKLEAECKSVQGKIMERKWEYIDGPPELVLITPSQDGNLQLSKPGIYKFKYRCTDSFGGTALSPMVTVTAKPPYVLGIDLGTSTTCIAIIKEDGTRQDIGIYEGDTDTDPCMPSIVAFSRNGELLIGEKALRQAVVNPESTIYEVKRLMGRSYYDDANHKFAYRVRPTLKSHSLKGVRAAVEVPCGKFRKKLVQPELVSALILRHVTDHAQKYLKVAVNDVVISVPAQFDDAQRKATMDSGLIAGLNPIKIVNEPTVAAFAANNLTEKLLGTSEEEISAEVERDRSTVWAVVADIGGGTTDYALMQIQGSYYKVITTDGDKTLGGRDIDIRLAAAMTEILQDKYPGLDFTTAIFKQKLRIECENAKIVLSKKEQYSLTVDYVDEDEHVEKLPLEYLLTRDEFNKYVSGILEDMVKPLDSLSARAGGLSRANIEDLYLVGGTSHIPKLKELLLSYFNNVKNIRHKDPVQLVSRGAAAFGAALTGLIQVGQMPRIDAVPLPISIAVDMDDMHVIFERNRLYPCIEKRVLTTYTNNQNAIVIKVYEGEGRTADECHFLGEFELSGIPPFAKNVPQIQATFKIDTNGILSVKASFGDMVKAMKLDVYSKSGGMIDKTREKISSLLSKLMTPDSKGQPKCEMLEDATPMSVIPQKPSKSNVLKLSVDSEYDSVKMADSTNPNSMVPAVGLVAVKGLVTDYDSASKKADLDIVLVVDLSGSMTGVPIMAMKNVILHLIDLLKENHRLGIVTYATNVYRNLELVSCTESSKNEARRIVHDFSTLGSTNLYGGLLTGLQMAYHGGRRSRVLLFTDGHANDGLWINNDDIIREIVRETTALTSLTQAQVMLSTFGYLGEHDEFLLQQLATNVGGGTYNFLNENTALGSAFAQVLGDAIHTVAERIQLTITPLDGVQILEAITNFTAMIETDKLTFEIPSTADQQSRHILLRLAVPPTKERAVHAGLYRVELTYTNTLTEREEGSEEYLFVARTEELDLGTRSRDVDGQLNRVFVARQIEYALEALKTNNREKPVELLKEAILRIQNSASRDHTLSVCLSEDLGQLIQEVEQGDLNTAKKSVQDSLTSHWQEKGGRSSCYVTRKEDKLISIFTT